MRFFFFIACAFAFKETPRSCLDCAHMIGREPGRCALFPDIMPEDILHEDIKKPIRFNFTPCPVARRYGKLCGKKAKCFKAKHN